MTLACNPIRYRRHRKLGLQLGRWQARGWRPEFGSALKQRKSYLDMLRTECSLELVADLALRSVIMWPGQIKSELLDLALLVHEGSPRVLLEIGTMNGGTFYVFCRLSNPNATVISLDMPGGPFGKGPVPFRGS